MDLAGGQQRLVRDDAADLVLPGDVGGGEDGDDPVLAGGPSGLQALDAAAGDRRGQDGGVKLAGERREIVDIVGFAADMKEHIVLLHGRSPAPMRPGKSSRKWAKSRRPSSVRL